MSEIRFHYDGQSTPWETERFNHRAQGHVPTAVARIEELREQHPGAAISIERRGERPRPRTRGLYRFRIFVKEGSLPVNDPLGVNGVSVTALHNATLFSRPFQENEREIVRAQIMEMFPKAELSEVAS